MKPFNLEQFLAGKQICNKFGELPTKVYFEPQTKDYPVCCFFKNTTVGERFYKFNRHGNPSEDSLFNHDPIYLTEYKWISLVRNKETKEVSAIVRNKKENLYKLSGWEVVGEPVEFPIDSVSDLNSED